MTVETFLSQCLDDARTAFRAAMARHRDQHTRASYEVAYDAADRMGRIEDEIAALRASVH